MKSLRTLRLIAVVSFASLGLAFAAEAKKDAPAAKTANCCARAAKDGKTCTHECCVTAAKEGKNCATCGGSGEVAAPAAKK
jgi:hypothetical protein